METQPERATNNTDPNEPPASGGQPITPQTAVPITPPPASKSPPVAQGNTEKPEGHQTNAQPTQSREHKKRIDSSAIWMIVLTGIIAVATGLNVWIFYLESESTGKQIDKLSGKAEGIVTSM